MHVQWRFWPLYGGRNTPEDWKKSFIAAFLCGFPLVVYDLVTTSILCVLVLEL